MAKGRSSLVRRAFVQMDMAFWCIHENAGMLAGLGTITLGATLVLALVAASVWRTWDLPGGIDYLLAAVLCPAVGLLILVFGPLPCAVFAWERAQGNDPSAGACMRQCLRRGGRLAWLAVRLSLLWLVSFVFAGLPLLIVWPRTCLTPLVVLFEPQQRPFLRSRRLLREELAVYVLGTLHLGIVVVLGLTVAMPRIVLALRRVADRGGPGTPWGQWMWDHLWIFESISGAIIVTTMAVSWCMSLTLLYRDIRHFREGDGLRARIHELRDRLIPSERATA